MIENARDDEQEIGQAIDVAQKHRLDAWFERYHPALCAAAHRARDVNGRRGRRAAGENEPAQWRQFGLELVDQFFEAADVRVGEAGPSQPRGDPVGRIGELGAERKDVALELQQHRFERPGRIGRAGEPEPGIELVDVAVGLDPRIVFADARAVEQRGLAGVARARVEFHDGGLYEMTTRGRATLPLPAPADRRRFRSRLLAWYRQHGRDLPWRKTDDPYHILVSEIMLQQTQVDRVLPKYGEWLRKYPSFAALATAPEQEVADTWYPLGYNIRPRRLQTIAREAVARYGGQLPSDEQSLLSFKGIGAYTAGAIRSFAFGQRAAILDTNVARVLFRVFVGKGDPKSHAMKRHLWAISETLVPSRQAFDFNQALMDLGAMVCVARNPKCLVCPMTRSCRTVGTGTR
jgi:A/G-specific adenine glycosylase